LQIFYRSRVTAAVADEFCKHIAVGTCNGEISVINFSSGGVLYNLPHRNLEITSLKFLTGCKYLHFNFLEGEFWIVAGTWSGTIILYT
jgi:hypothetical protein